MLFLCNLQTFPGGVRVPMYGGRTRLKWIPHAWHVSIQLPFSSQHSRRSSVPGFLVRISTGAAHLNPQDTERFEWLFFQLLQRWNPSRCRAVYSIARTTLGAEEIGPFTTCNGWLTSYSLAKLQLFQKLLESAPEALHDMSSFPPGKFSVSSHWLPMAISLSFFGSPLNATFSEIPP